jgi:hypothetical protein
VDLPIRAVTQADVERLVRREFSPADAEQALTILGEYTDRETQRVRAAAIKLSDGDLTHLRQAVSVAQVDWRDVLAPAEFPSQCGNRFDQSTEPEKEAIRRRDWDVYWRWFVR